MDMIAINSFVTGLLLSSIFSLPPLADQSANVAGSMMPPQEISKFIVSKHHPKHTIKIQATKEKAVFSVNSPTAGGGTFTATPTQGQWPEKVTVFLEDFQRLEGFELTLGQMVGRGSHRRSGNFSLHILGQDMNSATHAAVGSLDIIVEQRPRGIAVVFPPHLFINANTVKFHWVQVYLN